jgi:hypothetical protein
MESLHRSERVERTDALVTAVLAAVAESEGCDPLDLPPLYERVDPEALAALPRDTGFFEISFRYCGHLVTVAGDGDVSTAPVRD